MKRIPGALPMALAALIPETVLFLAWTDNQHARRAQLHHPMNPEVASGVSGCQVHDAHLVASMLVHGVIHLLTFNDTDFRRYPGLTIVHPSEVPLQGGHP